MTAEELMETQWSNQFWDQAAAIEFAKAFARYHVRLALEAAATKGKAYASSNGEWISSNVGGWIDKKTIYGAYPLTKIK